MTTIHIPDALLERVDRRARALHTSRNRFILDAIEASLGAKGSWPPELVQMLREPLDAGTAAELERTMKQVRARRTSRRCAPKR
jgi:predicted transcriptional regulator